ncbi:hypothetical protein [Clostridium cuniculi]|uniref:hypothetical protein n=1 Tax=Clostridium cuniculi TaxID=2548455 RepID=UPI001054E9D5|nr:hypothetical protein [Clostridium cuniculi]
MENKIKELENKIALEKEKCVKYIKKAEEIKVRCTDLIIEEIKNKIKNGIENYVKTDVENTNKLGLEKLSILKRQMNECIANVDNLKNSILERNIDIWKVSQEFIETVDFKDGDNFGKAYNNKREINSNIESLVRDEYSKIGELLYSFNYIDKSLSSDWELKNGSYVYKYGIIMFGEVSSSIKEYEDIFEKYFKANERIEKYDKELKETNALLLWSKA